MHGFGAIRLYSLADRWRKIRVRWRAEPKFKLRSVIGA
jgi:hypothetical protein